MTKITTVFPMIPAMNIRKEITILAQFTSFVCCSKFVAEVAVREKIKNVIHLQS